ncbi:hypothetical protein [Niallia taxi]|uniref:hypothetical protein n=1 Tax=Niallia taxi TaxID=2499688 RepID=UPI00300A2A7A
MKKIIILGSTIFILGVMAILLFLCFKNDGITVTITNNTEQAIDNIFITHSNLKEDIKLPKVLSKGKVSLNFEPDVSESNLVLNYFDQDGENMKNLLLVILYVAMTVK